MKLCTNAHVQRADCVRLHCEEGTEADSLPNSHEWVNEQTVHQKIGFLLTTGEPIRDEPWGI